MSKIPSIVFIVPYRDRCQHKFFFCRQMQFILESRDDYEIYFSHQCDERGFNRGAMKNIGFLAIKEKYPNHYQHITFVFHDVDTLPFHKLFQYETEIGIVKHFYGFQFALGGIVSIKGMDFEKINGYPCYWSWGLEDTNLQYRCKLHHIKIDRSSFYPLGSPEILQLFEGVKRLINRSEPKMLQFNDSDNGLSSITNLTYSINNQSSCVKDNIYTISHFPIHYVNIQSFETCIPYHNDFFEYDLRDNYNKIIHAEKQNVPEKNVPEKRVTESRQKIPIKPNYYNMFQFRKI
jgi:hypothetical protein